MKQYLYKKTQNRGEPSPTVPRHSAAVPSAMWRYGPVLSHSIATFTLYLVTP